MRVLSGFWAVQVLATVLHLQMLLSMQQNEILRLNANLDCYFWHCLTLSQV